LNSNNLGALKSFGLAANSGNSSKRIPHKNFLELTKPRGKRRASVMYRGNVGKGLGSFHQGSLYGGEKGGAPSGLRRSFLGASNLIGMRKSSVNKKFVQDEEEDNSLGTDYSDDDNKELEYRQRNKDLYKTLKKIAV